MKTTLIVIQNEADHADAKKLIEKLMGSGDPQAAEPSLDMRGGAVSCGARGLIDLGCPLRCSP
jgi:hypothetical protein